MANKRKKSGTRKEQKRIFIVCEGKKNKSEYSYWKAFIDDCKLPLNKVSVEIIDSKKNTAKELIGHVAKLRDFDSDSCWALFDKDGYTKHAQAFSIAKKKMVKIGFSSISFEYWLLIHFRFTTRGYTRSEELIKKEFIHIPELENYNKTDRNIYLALSSSLNKAVINAKKIQKHHEDCCQHKTEMYDWNPYTNLDKLIEDIKSLEE